MKGSYPACVWTRRGFYLVLVHLEPVRRHTHPMAADKTREVLKHVLADFQGRDDDGDLWTKADRVRIEPKELSVPGLVLFLLTRIMGLRNLGPDEKTAWHVPIGFRGHRVTIASHKFGVRLYIHANRDSRESAEDIGREVIQRLAKALGIVEREVLADYACRANRRRSGHRREPVSQASRHVRTLSRRGGLRVRRISGASEAASADGREGRAAGVFAGINEKIRQEQIGAWEILVAVNAYFSVLEHELVLVSAFSDL